MSDKIKQIAERIKELRKISGIPPGDLARELKVSGGLYRKYENGTSDIPVSFLYEISRKFNVELTALLTGGQPHLHTYCLVKKETAPSVDRRKEYKYLDLAYNFSRKKAEIFLVTVEPGSRRTRIKFNTHPGQEFDHVLEGTLKVILDGHELVLKRGDSLYFDSGIKHAMVAQNNKPARFLAIIL
ncbi:MAG: cupin domain-containing protein [Candidatus Omnitrophica bacterium]|jgi:quercetin dioxygenase-like cupin family protein|nr:cupin domain-containing protein [Candidatus Omnitrophota bacterium]MDD5079959.1 cupin domain-containing protein [Candidatus Omnitrophota bacterium]